MYTSMLPSTRRDTPVMESASPDARTRAAWATVLGGIGP